MRLPPITEEEIRQYQEAVRWRGEFQDAVDAFAEIAGVSREEWLHRVEEYKAKHPRNQGQPSCYRTIIERGSTRLDHGGLVRLLLCEVYLRLTEDWGDNPWQLLHRKADPTGGMYYAFEFIDPENLILTHRFTFLVLYGQDEETLLVPYGIHAKISVL